MKQSPKFQSGPDIARTRKGLGANVNKAIESGVIVDTCADLSFNQQKECSEVGMRISEPFDAIEYDRAMSRFRKKMKDLDKE